MCLYPECIGHKYNRPIRLPVATLTLQMVCCAVSEPLALPRARNRPIRFFVVCLTSSFIIRED